MAARILVLSANSNVGAEAVRQLRQCGMEVRAGVRNMGKAGALRALGAEVVEADLDRPETFGAALDGIKQMLLSTGASLDIAEVHGRLYGPARAAGVRYVVRISAIGANPRAKVALGRSHGEGERGLEASGLEWTHLRPHSFLQNLLGSAASIAGEGKLYGCMGEGRVPHVDVRDIAGAAVACLTQSGHSGKAYDITGPAAVPMTEVAAQLGRALGRPVEYVDLPAEAWVAGGIAAGMPEWLVRDLAYYSANVFAKNLGAAVSPAVRDLTGRDPISVEQFARDYAPAFQAATRTVAG